MKPRTQFLAALGFFGLMLWISQFDSDFTLSNRIAGAVNWAIPWLGLACAVVIVVTYGWLTWVGLQLERADRRAKSRSGAQSASTPTPQLATK